MHSSVHRSIKYNHIKVDENISIKYSVENIKANREYLTFLTDIPFYFVGRLSYFNVNESI